MMKRGLIYCLLILLAACSGDEKITQVEQKAKHFEVLKSNYAELSGWNDDRFDLFDKSIKSVCKRIIKNPNNYLNSDHLQYSIVEYKKHCKEILEIDNKSTLKSYVRKNFNPYLIMVDGSDEGKFTSYYEADINASYEKSDKYRYPIYGKPKDMIEVNLKDFNPNLPDERLIGRVKDGKLIKYYTREEIETGKIDAPVILWGDNLVDIHIMQIQGAAVAVLPDGSKVRVGYADNNGHKFRGIGSILLSKNLISPADASMPKIRDWLNKNGQKAVDSMLLNNRFIFHQIVEASGPIGAYGLPLVEGRALAVDRSYIPLGSIMWLETTGPNRKKINKAVMAQDVGSAIKGGVRGDYFWGHGEEAFLQAGSMNAKGRYFILIPKGAEINVK